MKSTANESTLHISPLAGFLEQIHDPALRTLLRSRQGFELYRAIDNEIFLHGQNQPVCLGIASARAAEGRTSIAILLAALTAAYAPQRRVLMLDANMSVGGLGRLLGLADAAPGLHDFCYANRTFADCVHKTVLPNLDCMPIGQQAWEYSKLSQEGFARCIAEAHANYQLVVVDTPPGSENRDLVSMAQVLKTVLMVIRYGYATREQIRPLVNELQTQQVAVLGAVLNQRIYPIPHLFYGK